MFSAEKILQVIGYLLSLNGDKMNKLKLMKELYLIDRESIKERDSSVSMDIHFSLPHGPILSATLNMLDDLDVNSDNSCSCNSWSEYLKSEPSMYYPDIVLKKKTPDDRLSAKDKEYIDKISDMFKAFTNKEIEDYTHKNLPEWKDPRGSCLKIRFQDIMQALGKSSEEIQYAKKEYDFLNEAYSDFGRSY